MTLPWFHKGDLDGFFGLFVDNLLQLMLIVVLCQFVCGLPADLIHGRIIPAAAVSILLGNWWYARQAKQLAERTGRRITCALPYGINTVSLFAFVFFVMAPVYHATQNSTLAWQAGLFACLGSGLIEIAGAFCGPWLRRHTPRAALLAALAGIAITFISMGFVFQIFSNPAIAIIPAMLILFGYSSRVKLPGNLPIGFVALLLGTAIAWAFRFMGFDFFKPDPIPYTFALHFPSPVLSDLWTFVSNGQGWKYFGIILPMGLFNVLGSLQNLESAEAAGDRYDTKSSLLVNGIGTCVAALLGSPFPTTIYIGHPGWKAMGARWGYSLVNGWAITLLALVGGITLVLKVIPMEAMIGILLWVGIVIAAQAFKDVPRHHHLAAAMGLIPSLAAWALLLIETSLRAAGTTLYATIDAFAAQSFFIHGVIALERGFLLTATIFAAILVHTSEKNFVKAAWWCAAASALAFLGLIHAWNLTPEGLQYVFAINAAPKFSAAYLAAALMLLALHQFGTVERDRPDFKRGRGPRGRDNRPSGPPDRDRGPRPESDRNRNRPDRDRGPRPDRDNRQPGESRPSRNDRPARQNRADRPPRIDNRPPREGKPQTAGKPSGGFEKFPEEKLSGGR